MEGQNRKPGGVADQVDGLERELAQVTQHYEQLREDHTELRIRLRNRVAELNAAVRERDEVRQQNVIIVANLTAFRDQCRNEIADMQDRMDAMVRGFEQAMNTAFESMTRQVEDAMGVANPKEPKQRGHMYGKVLSQARENAVAAGEAPYDDPLAAIAADLDQRRQ